MTATGNYILFYGDQPFSNFTKCDIKWNGETFGSVEQLYQFRKAIEFGDSKIARIILNDDNPRRAKLNGRLVDGFVQTHWDNVSYDIMKECVDMKFKQNPELLTELRKWGGIFVEASPGDFRWGIGFSEDNAMKNKSKWGLNWLGKILTYIRDNG